LEHTFFIYYPNRKFELESLVKAFGRLNMPMNRAGVGTGIRNEITSFSFDPFNKQYNGLQVTFLFTNDAKKYNKLLPENINNLLDEVEYEQVCYLHFNDIDPWQLTKEQIEQVDLIFDTIGGLDNLLIYSNGHQYYNLDFDALKLNKEKLLNEINEKWN